VTASLIDPAAAPEVVMPVLEPAQGPTNALERASLYRYLLDGHGTRGEPTLAQVRSWRTTYPTPASMLTQLRAAILPLLGRAA
jgi:hypothetical protein